MQAQQFFDCVKPTVAALKAKGLDRRIYSDVIDAAGHQYVDLVMEGGMMRLGPMPLGPAPRLR